jgi:signal transduction histidine kinase
MQAHDHTSTGSNFLPHGFCYLWDPHLLWTHVIADFLIGAAYVIIAVSLAWLVHRVRSDIPFSWAFVAFGFFIITCGMTHFMEIWTLWEPVYWLSGGVKVVTAVASVATAAAMPFTVPRAVATVRDARLAREREVAQARASALEEQNALLQDALEAARSARTEAERASEAKSIFLRTMSHELRTPLNAVIGYAQLLEVGTAGAVTEKQQAHLERISLSARHLLTLIDEVLILTRDTREWREPTWSRVPLDQVLESVRVMTEPQAAARQLNLRVAGPAQLEVETDVQWLTQILLNLVANAIKFTEAGSVTLEAHVDDADLLVRIEDTGIGVEESQRALVFQPFWQAEQGTTRSYGGTGLGLSVSRELARRMGGDITVDSVPGTGSTFTVRLPRHRPLGS